VLACGGLVSEDRKADTLAERLRPWPEHVSFTWSDPNSIPLPASAIDQIVKAGQTFASHGRPPAEGVAVSPAGHVDQAPEPRAWNRASAVR
jgi:hypothetical protein